MAARERSGSFFLSAAPNFPLPTNLTLRILSDVRALCNLATSLNRSTVYLCGLQKRFGLPTFGGAAYSPASGAFLRGSIKLRTFDISEETLRDLGHLEQKRLQLLQGDSCGATSLPERRLLLTNHDLGVSLTGSEVQTGLNFADSLPELFAGQEMGEDPLRVLREGFKLSARLLAEITIERPHVRAAVKWTAPRAKRAQSHIQSKG